MYAVLLRSIEWPAHGELFFNTLLGVMTFGLIAGLTFLVKYEWLANGLRVLFHITLALNILILGHYLLTLDNYTANGSPYPETLPAEASSTMRSLKLQRNGT